MGYIQLPLSGQRDAKITVDPSGIRFEQSARRGAEWLHSTSLSGSALPNYCGLGDIELSWSACSKCGMASNNFPCSANTAPNFVGPEFSEVQASVCVQRKHRRANTWLGVGKNHQALRVWRRRSPVRRSDRARPRTTPPNPARHHTKTPTSGT